MSDKFNFIDKFEFEYFEQALKYQRPLFPDEKYSYREETRKMKKGFIEQHFPFILYAAANTASAHEVFQAYLNNRIRSVSELLERINETLVDDIRQYKYFIQDKIKEEKVSIPNNLTPNEFIIELEKLFSEETRRKL